MTAGRRPVWLAADAAPALALRRPLGLLARPAGRGRATGRRVMFAVAPTDGVDAGARYLSAQLVAVAGPTRCGLAVVEAHLSHEAVAQALREPLMQPLPVAALNATLAQYDDLAAALGSAALLVASCPVLWPQTAELAGLS